MCCLRALFLFSYDCACHDVDVPLFCVMRRNYGADFDLYDHVVVVRYFQLFTEALMCSRLIQYDCYFQ